MVIGGNHGVADISAHMQWAAGAPPAANTTAGFVQTHGVGVCRGRYAPALRREWHAWDARNVSENDAPEMFQGDQVWRSNYF